MFRADAGFESGIRMASSTRKQKTGTCARARASASASVSTMVSSTVTRISVN